MLISELLCVLESSPIADIYVPGFIDDGTGSTSHKYLPQGGCEFHFMADDMYLQMGSRLIHCHAPEQGSRMSVTLAEQIVCMFDIDPDDTFGVASVFRLSRRSGSDSARVLRLDVFLGDGCDAENCVFAALGVLLEGDDYLFFDPMDFDGIRIGDDRARDAWVTYWETKYSMSSYMLKTTEVVKR
jgi:hypothetical protein